MIKVMLNCLCLLWDEIESYSAEWPRGRLNFCRRRDAAKRKTCKLLKRHKTTIKRQRMTTKEQKKSNHRSSYLENGQRPVNFQPVNVPHQRGGWFYDHGPAENQLGGEQLRNQPFSVDGSVEVSINNHGHKTITKTFHTDTGWSQRHKETKNEPKHEKRQKTTTKKQ